MRWVLAVLLGLGCNGFTQDQVPSEDYELYFLDFEVETFRPVTIQNIESKATCHVRLEESDLRASSLLHLLVASAVPDDGTFDLKRVRLKIVDSNGRANYIDSTGRLLGSEGLDKMIIQRDAMTRLMVELDHLATAEDCRDR